MGKYMTADARNPYMGLDNKVCKNPAYWCRLKQIWLSEEDARRKNCREKQDFNMLGTHRCGYLEKKAVQQGSRKRVRREWEVRRTPL